MIKEVITQLFLCHHVYYIIIIYINYISEVWNRVVEDCCIINTIKQRKHKWLGHVLHVLMRGILEGGMLSEEAVRMSDCNCSRWVTGDTKCPVAETLPGMRDNKVSTSCRPMISHNTSRWSMLSKAVLWT